MVFVRGAVTLGCKKFPLIVGGTEYWTYLTQFDLNPVTSNELIAAARTDDYDIQYNNYFDVAVLIMYKGLSASS